MKRFLTTVVVLALALSIPTAAPAQEGSKLTEKTACSAVQSDDLFWLVRGGTTDLKCAYSVVESAILDASFAFKTIDTPSGTDPVADAKDDTLTLTCSGGITCTGDSATDTVAIAGADGGPRILDTVSSSTTISNDNTEQTVYTYTIPASTLPSDGRLVLELQHAYINNTGGTRGVTWKVKLGGTEAIGYATSTNYFGSNAGQRHGVTQVVVQALDSTSSQDVYINIRQAGVNSNGTYSSGQGQGIDTGHVELMSRASAPLTKDMTASQALVVTVQLSGTASSSHSWEIFSGSLRLEAP